MSVTKLKPYIVQAHTHDLGRRHLRIAAASPQEARQKALGCKGVRNVVKVLQA